MVVVHGKNPCVIHQFYATYKRLVRLPGQYESISRYLNVCGHFSPSLLISRASDVPLGGSL